MKRQINWPTDEELLKLISEKPKSEVAKEIGVSDSGLGKRCRLRGLVTDEIGRRGYWQKQKAALKAA